MRKRSSNIHLFDAFANLFWYHNIEIVAIYCVIIRADKRSIFLGPLHVVALMTESEALAQKNKKTEVQLRRNYSSPEPLDV